MGQSRKRIGADGKARYTAYYDDVTGRRRSVGTYPSRRDADRAWQRAETDATAGRHTDSGRSRQLFNRYVEDEWFPNHQIELTTRQNYRYVLDKHILPVFGGYKMIAILPTDIRAWVTSLSAAGVKPATIKHCLAVLSAIFTTAFNDQITSLNPTAGIKAPPVPPATRRIITPEQFDLIHAALPTREMQLMVETDAETGLRWGELVELRVRDLDLHHGMLSVSRTVIEIPAKFHPTGGRFLIKNYPKDKQPRRLGLSTHIQDQLREHVRGRGPTDLVFPAPPSDAKDDPTVDGPADSPAAPAPGGLTEPNAAGRTYRHGTITAYNMAPCRCAACRGAYATYRARRRASGADGSRAISGPVGSPSPEIGQHISRTWFRRQIWQPALELAGLEFHVRVHDLRHAHASWLLSGGADLQAVKDRMGRARLTTTEQYLHTLPHADAATITALNNIRNRS
ncbi:tyrosine-type recombinase/integrase [uncultured Jatrophihabitans sp.]|uniref:tyrosine-type recombinase/integrase n=1 Tax=uncultured Jatrophihabitans sp. TaxID=1610747 RepID=UPI0035CC9150